MAYLTIELSDEDVQLLAELAEAEMMGVDEYVGVVIADKLAEERADDELARRQS